MRPTRSTDLYTILELRTYRYGSQAHTLYSKPNHSSTIATDEQVYGTSDPLNHPPGENDPQLHSSAEAKKDTGLVRQIL